MTSSKLQPFLLKQLLKLKKGKTINQKRLYIKIQSKDVFLDITKMLISGGKILMSAEIKVFVTQFIYFSDLL